MDATHLSSHARVLVTFRLQHVRRRECSCYCDPIQRPVRFASNAVRPVRYLLTQPNSYIEGYWQVAVSGALPSLQALLELVNLTRSFARCSSLHMRDLWDVGTRSALLLDR